MSFEEPKNPNVSEKEKWNQLADKLDKMQKELNNGRGVSCVQTIIVYLRAGDADKARAVCNNDGDKLRNYDAIAELLEDELGGDFVISNRKSNEKWERMRKKWEKEDEE